MNIFNFGQYTTAFLLLTTIPILAVAITLIIMDRRFNTNFYNEQGDLQKPILSDMNIRTTISGNSTRLESVLGLLFTVALLFLIFALIKLELLQANGCIGKFL
jgi:hypothetical protein